MQAKHKFELQCKKYISVWMQAQLAPSTDTRKYANAFSKPAENRSLDLLLYSSTPEQKLAPSCTVRHSVGGITTYPKLANIEAVGAPVSSMPIPSVSWSTICSGKPPPLGCETPLGGTIDSGPAYHNNLPVRTYASSPSPLLLGIETSSSWTLIPGTVEGKTKRSSRRKQRHTRQFEKKNSCSMDSVAYCLIY